MLGGVFSLTLVACTDVSTSPSLIMVAQAIHNCLPESWSMECDTASASRFPKCSWYTLIDEKTPHYLNWGQADISEHKDIVGLKAITIGISTNGEVRTISGRLKGIAMPCIYSSGKLYVYAFRDAKITDDLKLHYILNRATVTKGDDSPISWARWQTDIVKAIKGIKIQRGNPPN